jgi:hypothetical protein
VSIEAFGRGVGRGGVLKTKMIDSQESSFVSSVELWNKLYSLQFSKKDKEYLYYSTVIFKLESGDTYIYIYIYIYTHTHTHTYK